MWEEILTSTESIVWWWKEYFKDLLNPTNTYSTEEDFGLVFLIKGVEVAGAVKQLHFKGPALLPDEGTGVGMGVCPTSPRVFCESGEGL